MKGLILAALLMSGTLCAAQVNELNPSCMNIPSYNTRLDAAFDLATKGKPMVDLDVIPSFQIEWGIRVTSLEGGSYSLQYITFDDQLWHASWMQVRSNSNASVKVEDSDGTHSYVLDPSVAKVHTIVKSIGISEELAMALKQLVSTAIASAKKSDLLGFDGITYRFSVGGTTCAQAWTPQPDTQPGRLAALFESLREIAQSGAPTISKSDEQRLLTQTRAIEWH